MPTIPQEAALSKLSPYLPVLHRALVEGWADYQADPVGSRLKHSTRTRASIVYDYVMARLRTAFDNHPDVEIREVNRLLLLHFQNSIVVRIKKFNEALRSAGVRTKQRRRLLNQIGLPGVPALVHLEAGYQLDQLQTNIEGTYLVCPRGNDILWAQSLSRGNEGLGSVIPLPLPVPSDPVVRLRYDRNGEIKNKTGGDTSEGNS